MNSWHRLDLGDPRLESPLTSRIRTAWFPAHAAAGSSWAFAIFRTVPPENFAYFPPNTGEFALQFGAQPCARPTRGDLSLFLGDVRALDLIFPNE